MALSTLSPPLPSSATRSSASLSHPKLLHPIASTSFRNAPQNHNLSTADVASLTPGSLQKWRVNVSFFTSLLGNKSKDADAIKEELFEAIAPLDRGVEATPEDEEAIEKIVQKLEAATPTKEPLKSDFLNGKWELIYTTSASILQRERPKFLRSRINYQAINVDTLRAQNMETWPFFNQVTADLIPLNPRKVAVKFDYFKLGGVIPIKAPEKVPGNLEITYLDEELRVSRGSRGNLFILKMVDPSYRIPS